MERTLGNVQMLVVHNMMDVAGVDAVVGAAVRARPSRRA